MKTIAIIARVLLGAVFIFSGFVKIVDPWGSAYKIIDYFTAFNLSFLSPLAFMLGVLRDVAEFTIGVALVLGVRMKESSWAVLLFMGFFTVLTFVLALTDPVSDCGCFGDAIVLTNWQTFSKNAVLMVLAVVVFTYRKKYIPVYNPVGEWFWVAASVVVISLICLHSYRHLPLLDFRPYYVGADIPRGMEVPEGKPTDEFKTTLLYEKDGVVKEFSEQDYPWDDSTWVWKDTRVELVKKGYEPPIHDFSITTLDGDDITDDVLAFEEYTFLFVAYRLDKSDKNALDEAVEIASFCEDNGYRFYCLTSSPQSEIESLKSNMGLSYEFCFTDEITLKTIIRSNPGLVLLEKGTILGKWHYNDMPRTDLLSANLLSYSLQEQMKKSEDRLVNFLLLAFVATAFVFYHFRKKAKNH